MKLKNTLLAATALSAVSALGVQADVITVATVNNGDMIRMQGLTDDFTAKTGHTVEWVTLEENVLRQRVTTDITTKGGSFDVMTIGMYETPIWGANGWLVPLDDLSAEYDVGDLLPAMAGGLSHEGTLYAAPFYGESSMVMYRTDLMEAAGMEMPARPNGGQVALQIIQQYASQPDITERLQTDEAFAARLQKYAGQYQFAQQQQINATQYGQYGTAAASVGDIQTQGLSSEGGSYGG